MEEFTTETTAQATVSTTITSPELVNLKNKAVHPWEKAEEDSIS